MGKREDHYQVRLTRPYYLQTTPVTQGHWRMVMGSNPACFQGDEWRPVEQVSWHDCQHFIQRLNSLREGHYRLPTEAEWEYACRAGQSGAYSFGDRAGELPEYAWFDLNARGTTHPTGLKKANKFGLFDMHGNVWEWVQDRHGSFPNAVLTDPSGPTTGETRVIRGGAWNLSAAQCRADSRNYDVPEYSFRNLGLRLLLEVSDSFKL
jgi:formylglycine-generating enzyme required for sulfatase activity